MHAFVCACVVMCVHAFMRVCVCVCVVMLGSDIYVPSTPT